MVTIRSELPTDVVSREVLLDKAFGVARFRKTSARLREGRLPAEGLAFTALSATGRIIGTVRLWKIIAGSAGPSLLLGPLAIDGRVRGKGLGKQLMEHALATAKVMGYGSVLLVGDQSYYGRFGFSNRLTQSLLLPGPVDRQRFLGLELTTGALDGAEGLLIASGVRGCENAGALAA